jgi:hypothetical protein
LLSDLLGGGPSVVPQTKAPAASASAGHDLLGDLLGGGSPAPAPSSGSSFVAFSKNNCVITFQPKKEAADRVSCTAVVTTTGSFPLSNFDFKIAVPGYLALQLAPPSGTTVQPGGQITQSFVLQNKEVGKPYLIKVRVEFAGFPAEVSDVSFEGKL